MHYVVVVQIEPFGNYVLSFLPGTRDEDLRAALAKLPTAEDEYIFEFGTYHADVPCVVWLQPCHDALISTGSPVPTTGLQPETLWATEPVGVVRVPLGRWPTFHCTPR